MHDQVWQRPALTQPAAIKIVADFAKAIGAAKFFDAGDVQANGFQIVEDDRTGDTFTETGASYMGFAVSALLASAMADKPRYSIAFTGDGSFMMNPQILIDARRARRARHDRDLRQPAHGRDHRPADGAIQRRLPHQRSRRGRLRAARRAVAGVNAVHGGWTADELRERAAKPRTPTMASPSSTCRSIAGPRRTGRPRRLGQWNVGNWCEDVQRKWIEQDI